MKSIENFILDKKQPEATSLSWNYMICEDKKNKSLKIYDNNIFKKSSIFKIIDNDEEDEDHEDKEEKKREEKSKKEYKELLKRIDKLSTDIESYTNEIKTNMVLDLRKREEMRQKIEIEKRKRIQKEREEKEREEKEKREKALKEEEERRKIERERLQRKNVGAIKEKLIKAANNFENIKKEITKINRNKEYERTVDNIFKKIMGILPNVTTLDDIVKYSEEINKVFDEFKENKCKEFYLCTCYLILSRIKDILISSDLDYKDCYIKAKLINNLKSKTLTYMFYQNISNLCPYIIPVKDFESVFKDKEIIMDKNNKALGNISKNYRDITVLQYLYFIFIYLDINKNINIIEDYINNMIKFKPEDINYLVSNSFLCFINVFGNYIKRNKNNWMNNLGAIKNNIKLGLQMERQKTRYKDIKSLIDKINNDIEENYLSINKNTNTRFLKEIEKNL